MAKRLIDKLGYNYIPYDFIKDPITLRQKAIITIQNDIRHIDDLAEKYLQNYLRKRRKLLKKILNLPSSEKLLKKKKKETEIITCDICCKKIKGEPLKPSYVPKVAPIPGEAIRRLEGIVCSEKCAKKWLEKMEEYDIIAEEAGR